MTVASLFGGEQSLDAAEHIQAAEASERALRRAAGDGDFTRLPRAISIPATNRATPVQFEFYGVATVGRGRNPFKLAQVDGLLADTHVVLPVVTRIEGSSNVLLVCDNRIIDVEELPLTLSVNSRLLTVDAVVDNPVD